MYSGCGVQDKSIRVEAEEQYVDFWSNLDMRIESKGNGDGKRQKAYCSPK